MTADMIASLAITAGGIGLFLLGVFAGIALQRTAYQDANEPDQDLTDWEGDQQ